ncbi:ribonuclease III [Pseudonocardia sp. Cha107L01]|uniref:ribonuclease III n=1 Tax=Pseudonocardia sp. Cha107L01 TaxID=3457576 RepID=UPI00403EF6E6
MTAQLGVELDTELLTLALTHRSYAYEHGGLPTNERLEFLGDSVLGVIVTERLYRSHPDLPEGQLAKLRASVVNMHALASVARELGPPEPDGVPNAGLGAYLYLGRGEELTGGRGKASILADATEALIGAVYLAHGLEIARDVVERLFDGLLRAAPLLGAGLDWKTSLQELTASAELGVPEYRISEDGPDHLKTFTATAVVAGRELGTGMGRTKKEAEQKAAQLAWRSLSEGAGSANSGSANSGTANSGSTNSGTTNSGTTNSGSANSTDPDSHSATEPGAPDS